MTNRNLLLPWVQMSHIPTNILDQGGLRVARCDFDGDQMAPDARDNARLICEAMNVYTRMIRWLDAEEGRSIEWVSANADFEGPNHVAVFCTNFIEEKHVSGKTREEIMDQIEQATL